MTKQVKWWESRAVAAARAAKHAQRTPLPPRGSTGTRHPGAEIIRQMLDEEKAKNQ